MATTALLGLYMKLKPNLSLPNADAKALLNLEENRSECSLVNARGRIQEKMTDNHCVHDALQLTNTTFFF